MVFFRSDDLLVLSNRGQFFEVREKKKAPEPEAFSPEQNENDDEKRTEEISLALLALRNSFFSSGGCPNFHHRWRPGEREENILGEKIKALFYHYT